MKPLCTTRVEELHFVPLMRPHSRPASITMPLRHSAQTIGLEEYYLAAEARDLMATFHTPGFAHVVHIDQVDRCVRIHLPNPVGANLSHWLQHAARVYAFEPVCTSVTPKRQVFYMMASAYVRANADVVNSLAGLCCHGVPFLGECQDCEDMLPF